VILSGFEEPLVILVAAAVGLISRDVSASLDMTSVASD
jgi:hypothetical protein